MATNVTLHKLRHTAGALQREGLPSRGRLAWSSGPTPPATSRDARRGSTSVSAPQQPRLSSCLCAHQSVASSRRTAPSALQGVPDRAVAHLRDGEIDASTVARMRALLQDGAVRHYKR